MKSLTGKVALVTGASRGVGKGIAQGLGEAGATVYLTGRTVDTGKVDEGLTGTVTQTAVEVTRLGGRGIALCCDHRNDAKVDAAFKRIMKECARIDILVNNLWGGYEHIVELTWDHVFSLSLRPAEQAVAAARTGSTDDRLSC